MLTVASSTTHGTQRDAAFTARPELDASWIDLDPRRCSGDNSTWSVTVFCATGDHALKNLRHEEKWTKVVHACPLHAHWLDGEPATGVLAMSGIVDRYRRFVVNGAPVATGLVPLADAWACTNPSAGRGLTVGFLHAALLRRVVREAGATIPVHSSKHSTHEPNRT